jgi:hypothetical protein
MLSVSLYTLKASSSKASRAREGLRPLDVEARGGIMSGRS